MTSRSLTTRSAAFSCGEQLAEALTAYRHSLAVVVRLADRDPANTSWQLDLGIMHEHIGDVLKDQGDLAAAVAEYQAKRRNCRRLAGPSRTMRNEQGDRVDRL